MHQIPQFTCSMNHECLNVIKFHVRYLSGGLVDRLADITLPGAALLMLRKTTLTTNCRLIYCDITV